MEGTGTASFVWGTVGLVSGGLLTVALLATFLRQPAPSPPPTLQLSLAIPETVQPIGTALSPDGRHLGFTAYRAGRRRLFVRPLDRADPTEIPESQGATTPFFSPDGRTVGFFADGVLKIAGLEGSSPRTVCDAVGGSAGASWTDDDEIIFAPRQSPGLWRVSVRGGPPEPLTRPDGDAGEVAHGWPEHLPNGQGTLFTVAYAEARSRIALLSPGLEEWRPLFPGIGGARYLDGYVVGAQDGGLSAAAFDLDRLDLLGPPTPLGIQVAGGVVDFDGLGRAAFSVSRTGLLAYLPGGTPTNRAVWVDRDGRSTPLDIQPARFETPRLSRDGRLAIVRSAGVLGRDLWVHDLTAGTEHQVVTQGSDTRSPAWSWDSRTLAFASNQDGPQNLFFVDANAPGAPTRLSRGGDPQNPGAWTPDDTALVYYEVHARTARDLWSVTTTGERRPVLVTPADERAPAVSPDGRWLAYVSDESGSDEVYLRRFPEEGVTRQVSSDGGREPRWSRDGRELFYRRDDRMLAVAMNTDMVPGSPHTLFEGPYDSFPGGHTANYDVAADRQRFLMLERLERPHMFHVIVNWRGPRVIAVAPR